MKISSKVDETPENRPLNYKNVFQIWKNHIYKPTEAGVTFTEDCLTLTQLQNIFPEFRERIELYSMCCNEDGKIVKNHEFYKEYRKMNYAMKGKRGGK